MTMVTNKLKAFSLNADTSYVSHIHCSKLTEGFFISHFNAIDDPMMRKRRKMISLIRKFISNINHEDDVSFGLSECSVFQNCKKWGETLYFSRSP